MIGDRWGATDAETRLHYPCDDFVPKPAWQAWRGVTVDAPPDAVWPWIVQLRLAPYSYDWIDNLGRRSPRELQGLPDPRVGDPFTATAGRPIGKVVSVEAGVHLTAKLAGAYMSYVLVDAGQSTRLLLKLAARNGRVLGPLFAVGDLVMARKQLLHLKELAEWR
ncbi:polyketide cyclase [Aeromicrobium endophyticum]|uniref:Polyketide cyclase n=1 Tax=Aeromicrobium endophyticum TaxID=2292704 RepID=A0A371P9X8_9ACTN|nr:polyketide cyclase [Aeromicrobium endophyticum]REK72741.1 polyketide cyclase [Aeromicrobium endophyticum]